MQITFPITEMIRELVQKADERRRRKKIFSIPA
ncbi:uncharacterized protein METZ01_LOCUS20808, partial [marine metagenome]